MQQWHLVRAFVVHGWALTTIVEAPRNLATATGSVAEKQEFSGSEAKPTCRFRDRESVPLMTAHGWIGEWLLSKLHQGAGTVIASLLCRNVRDEF